MSSMKKTPGDDDLSDRGEEPSSCDEEQPREQFAASTTSSSTLPVPDTSEEPLPDSSEDDDQKVAAKGYASSSGMTSTEAQSSSTLTAQGQNVSKRRRVHQEHEGRFSFREPFLEKLRLMLDNETNADSGSIQWLDGEDAFVILDQNKFEKDIIPKYFTPIIFQSFLRKLYRWGFKRVSTTHAGRYKFASATFTRTAPNTALSGATGTMGIPIDPTRQAPLSVPPNAALEMLLRQQLAANPQPNQVLLSLLPLLQRIVQPAPTQTNPLSALANAIAQQSLSPIQMGQQLHQTRDNSILSLLVQQLTNPSTLQNVAPNVFPPAPVPVPAPVPDPNLLMRALGIAPQAPPVSYLNQNQNLNGNLATGNPSQDALALLLRNIQNAATTVASAGIAGGTTENSVTSTNEQMPFSAHQPPRKRNRDE